jgi:hypothetical protein
VRKGERVDHWFVRLRPTVKDQPSLLYGKEIKPPWEAGWLRGFFFEEIKVVIPETLCKTIIGFSPEYPGDIPNVATANETRTDDGCFFEAPASAKRAGGLHSGIINHR